VRHQAGLAEFSDFTLAMLERSATLDTLELFRWSVDRLSRTIGFDCCWGGWVDLSKGQADVYASLRHNLPDDYTDFWSDMKEEDLLAREVIATRVRCASYLRRGRRQTDGMVALSDQYHLDSMTVVSTHEHHAGVSTFLSAYRSGRHAPLLTDDEISFIYCALEHFTNLTRKTRLGGGHPILCANGEGRLIFASPEAHEIIREYWKDWNGEHLPEELLRDRPGRQGILPSHGMAAVRRTLEQPDADPITYVSLREAGLRDRLTPRELDVAVRIARGGTYKEIARDLGLAPATVRNHTRAILSKARVNNKAALGDLLATQYA